MYFERSHIYSGRNKRLVRKIIPWQTKNSIIQSDTPSLSAFASSKSTSTGKMPNNLRIILRTFFLFLL